MYSIPPKVEESNLETHDDAPLPNLTLVRDVVPEVGQERRSLFLLGGGHYSKSVVSESRFGLAGEEADLSCIHDGLKEALPSIDILSTSAFWEQVGAPDNSIELSELFVDPQSEWLRAIGADILVIPYHARIDVENDNVERVITGGYSDTDKETAAIIVIDLHRKSMIHGSRLTFEDKDSIMHFLFIVPLGTYTPDPADMCNTVAHQAGLAIAETMPDRPIRALVVLAGEEPIRAEEKRVAEFLEIFKDLSKEQPEAALISLCKSADSGDQEARIILKNMYEYGGYPWIKEGIVERDFRLAYVWYALSGADLSSRQTYLNYLTSEERLDAEKMLEDWRPGQCERDLGVVSFTE